MLRKTKILEEQLGFYKNRTEQLSKEVSVVNKTNYKYRRLFNQLFDRLQLTGVNSYKVEKDLTDGKVLFNIEYNDGTCYTYKVDLIATSYTEELNGNVQVDKER